MQPFYTVTGVVEAPLQQVSDLLLTVGPGPVGPDNAFFLDREGGRNLQLRGGPEKFTADIAGDGNGLHLEVDREQRMLAVQGQWWFRGEYRLEPHPKGTRITGQGFNIARTKRWAVPLVRIGVADKQRAAAERLLRRIGARLDAVAYLE